VTWPPTAQPGSGAPAAPPAPDTPAPREGVAAAGAGSVLDLVRTWLERFVCTMADRDLDLLTLWAAHRHLVVETYTTPRLVIDSPVPGSGKTTVLEHLERLCQHPVQMASLSSPALLTRMLSAGMRTVLIDEADRSLNPDREGVAELLAVLNSGYKRGGTRPVLTPAKGGDWVASEMPTYCPVVMAGNSPRLPEDTLSRTIRVLLLPDLEGRVEESDWELYDQDARALGEQLAAWAQGTREAVRTNRPALPEGIKGRARERWSPLKRVAEAAGGRWPAVVDEMALHDKEQHDMDREDGMVRDRPAVLLLKHTHDLWPDGEAFFPTSALVAALVARHPDEWGVASPFGKPLTVQRLGRILASSYGVNSTRLDRLGPRGYSWASLVPVWRRMGVKQGPDRSAPVPGTPLPETGASGASGATGADCECAWQLEPDAHFVTCHLRATG
jgi:hypothetical protein